MGNGKGFPNEELGKRIGSRIKTALSNLKLPLVRAAEILGVSAPTLSRYAAGNTLPQVDFLIALYEHFKVNPLYILFGLEPMFIESLTLPTEKPKGDPSLTPFAYALLKYVRSYLELDDFQLYFHSKLKMTYYEFLELLRGIAPVDMETLRTLCCSFCVDINFVWEDRSYRPNIIKVGVFDWDRKLEENRALCPQERDIIVIDTAEKNYFYIWCKQGEYGGFILKVDFYYKDIDSLFNFLSKNIRVYIGKNIYGSLIEIHPYLALTLEHNYIYSSLSEGIKYLEDSYPDHPALGVIRRFSFLLQEKRKPLL